MKGACYLALLALLWGGACCLPGWPFDGIYLALLWGGECCLAGPMKAACYLALLAL